MGGVLMTGRYHTGSTLMRPDSSIRLVRAATDKGVAMRCFLVILLPCLRPSIQTFFDSPVSESLRVLRQLFDSPMRKVDRRGAKKLFRLGNEGCRGRL